MFAEIWVPDWLYRAWPYLMAAEAGLAFAARLDAVGILLLAYSIAITIGRKA